MDEIENRLRWVISEVRTAFNTSRARMDYIKRVKPLIKHLKEKDKDKIVTALEKDDRKSLRDFLNK